MKNIKSQSFGTREETVGWLDGCDFKNYTINHYLTVDVNDDVDLFRKNLKTIPIKFGKVTDNFFVIIIV